jgi:transcriptional accessory protein Tex/SPT6
MIEEIATKFELKPEQARSIIAELQQDLAIPYLLAAGKNADLSANKLALLADYVLEQKELAHYKKLILDFWQEKITLDFKQQILALDSKVDLYVLLPTKNTKFAADTCPNKLYLEFQKIWHQGTLYAKRGVVKHSAYMNKYRDFFQYEHMLSKISPEHAAILLKGRNLNCLQLTIKDGSAAVAHNITDAIFYKLRYLADTEILKAINNNFSSLLHTPMLVTPKVTVGVAINSGLHLAVLDNSGKILDYQSIYAFSAIEERHEVIVSLAKICVRYGVEVFVVANNNKQRFIMHLLNALKEMYSDLHFAVELVNDAGGASYANHVGLSEYPGLDPRYIEAISIAKRKTDMLAELVKIAPKDLLLHNYQKDVGQKRLELLLQRRFTEAVSKKFVDLNLASKFILQYVPGLNLKLAALIVDYRDKHGKFNTVNDLRNLPGITNDIFAQAGFFLRVYGGEEILDALYIHPDEYDIVMHIAKHAKLTIKDLIGNVEVLNNLNIKDFADFDYARILRIIYALGAQKVSGLEPKRQNVQSKQTKDKPKVTAIPSKVFNPMMANAFLKLKHRSE